MERSLKSFSPSFSQLHACQNMHTPKTSFCNYIASNYKYWSFDHFEYKTGTCWKKFKKMQLSHSLLLQVILLRSTWSRCRWFSIFGTLSKSIYSLLWYQNFGYCRIVCRLGQFVAGHLSLIFWTVMYPGRVQLFILDFYWLRRR